MKTKLFTYGAAAALLVTASFFGALPANATETPSVIDRAAASTVDITNAPECLELVEAGIGGLTPADCELTTETSVGDTFAVTAATVESDKSLTSVQRSQLLDSMGTVAVTGRHYSQFTIGGAYSRTHNGTFYFNGSRAWVTVSYAGLAGSHACFTDYSIGLTIAGTECSDSGGSNWRTLRDRWTVGWGTVGAYSVTMACTVYANGTIAGPGATVG